MSNRMLSALVAGAFTAAIGSLAATSATAQIDRKSTRLNSSHITSSYAVFCLKKKKHEQNCFFPYPIFLLCRLARLATLVPGIVGLVVPGSASVLAGFLHDEDLAYVHIPVIR